MASFLMGNTLEILTAWNQKNHKKLKIKENYGKFI